MYINVIHAKLDVRFAVVERRVVFHAARLARAELRGRNEATLQKLADAGMKINQVSPEALAAMREATAPVYDANRETIGQDTLDALDAALGR